MMEHDLQEKELEQKRLEETLLLANKQLEQARTSGERAKEEILEAKRELRENTSHSIGSLWGSEAFEALADLNQYANPVSNKIADYEETQHKIAQLERILKTPYFARIDFKFEGEDEFEKIYIGRSSLKKEDSYDMDIYDWRSPIASVFYRFVLGNAFYEAPAGRIDGEVCLKRQYEIPNGELEFFFDADIQIVDEFLRKLLSQNTSDKMKAIVETIQKEQDIVIRDMESDLMMVQGVAGSGKTSVALHRAAYLMYKGLSAKLASENIMIISPNSLFEQYISQVLPELGEENVISAIFEEMMKRILKRERIQSRNQFLERVITQAGDGMLSKNSLEFKTSPLFIEMLEHFVQDLPKQWIVFEDFYYEGHCVATKEMIRNKITSRKDTLLGVKLKQLEDYILERIGMVLQIVIRKSEEALIRQEVQKFTQLSILELYKKLVEHKTYLYQLADGKRLPDSMEEIIRYTRKNFELQQIPYEDAIVLTYLELKINGNNAYKNIKQVVIDEAQDYYPMHYEIFKMLFGNANYTILGDINQTLEKEEGMDFYEQIADILQKKKVSLITMDKSFRCTNEILNYSSKFLDKMYEIKSFNREGEKPQVFVLETQKDLVKSIKEEVKHCKEQGYRSIGLLVKSEKNASSLYASLKGMKEVQLIKEETTSELDGVFIIPVYLSKGLEFDGVIICDADASNYTSEDDKKLLYIASTRALHRLTVLVKGEASKFL